jgi:hypothetical protein
MPQQAPFVIDPHLTGIAIAYKNPDLIADLVMPMIDVGQKEYKYTTYPVGEEFQAPNTLVGRRGNVPRLELTGADATGSCLDYGLDVEVVQDDIDQAAARGLPNPLDRATEKSVAYVDLGHEMRVAAIVFAATTYPVANKATLSGDDQFSDPDSDAVKLVMDALDVPLMRPNTLVFGQASWTGFRMNPKVVAATNKNSGDSGVAARQAVADLLEVKTIVVGQSRLNTAKPGQAAALSRVWGKHLAMLYVDPLADNQSGITFGWTARYTKAVGASYFDPKIGVRGAQVARAAKTLDERVIAADCGYLFTNAVA